MEVIELASAISVGFAPEMCDDEQALSEDLEAWPLLHVRCSTDFGR